MKVCEVASTIAKEHPELLKTGSFKPPTTRCSAWIVVRKPSADNRFYEATVKAPAPVVAVAAEGEKEKSAAVEEEEEEEEEEEVGS